MLLRIANNIKCIHLNYSLLPDIYAKITFGIPFADFTPEPRHCCEGFSLCNGGLGTWYLLGITLVLCAVVVVAYQQSSVRTSELLELNELV